MAYTTIDDPSAYFQTTLWTGNDTARSITNTGNSDLQPDWVWINNYGSSQNNRTFDSVRGAGINLVTIVMVLKLMLVLELMVNYDHLLQMVLLLVLMVLLITIMKV